MPDWAKTFVGMEAAAAEIRADETELVSGLLQTEGIRLRGHPDHRPHPKPPRGRTASHRSDRKIAGYLAAFGSLDPASLDPAAASILIKNAAPVSGGSGP